jgi:hypothetical protein
MALPPVRSPAHRGLALATFVVVAALQPAARAAAAFLPGEHHGTVVTLSRLVGAVLFGIAACFVSFRTLAVLSSAGGGLAFLACALTDLSTLAWLSLLLVAFGGALEVASYLLVLDSITHRNRHERAWWLLKDSLVWLSLLFAPRLSVAFLSGGGAVACALLLAVALTQPEPTSPAPRAQRASRLLLGAGGAVSFALSVLALESNRSLQAGQGAGRFIVASLLGQLLLLLAVRLSAVAWKKPVGTLTLVGWILVGAAPLLPWATLVDIPALTVVSGASNGSVAAASSLVLLALLQPLPRKLQPLAVAGWLCIGPVVEGWAAALGGELPPHTALLPVAAVLLLLATGLALLRASRVEDEALSASPSDR